MFWLGFALLGVRPQPLQLFGLNLGTDLLNQLSRGVVHDDGLKAEPAAVCSLKNVSTESLGRGQLSF